MHRTLVLTIGVFAASLAGAQEISVFDGTRSADDLARARVSGVAVVPAGTSTILNMAPILDGLGVTVDDDSGLLYNLAFDGTIEVRDLSDIAIVIDTFAPSTGSAGAHLGIAWDESGGVLHVATSDNELFQLDPSDGSVVATSMIQSPSATTLVGGLALDPTTGTLVGKDINDEILRRFETDGTFVEDILDPLADAIPLLAGQDLEGNGVAVADDGSIYTTSGIGRLGSDCVGGNGGPSGFWRLAATGEITGGRGGNLDFLIAQGADFINGVDVSSNGSTFFVDDATNLLFETDSIVDCAHAALSNHQCSEIAPGVIQGTYDENDSEEANVYANGVLAATVTGGSYELQLDPGVHVISLESVNGGEVCGAGNPCVIQSTRALPPACPDPGEIKFTQSVDPQTITALNSIACNAANITGNNFYFRVFPYDQFGQNNPVAIKQVQIGVEFALAGSGLAEQPGFLRISQTDVVPPANPSLGDLILLHEQAVAIGNATEGFQCIEIDPPIIVDPGAAEAFVVELEVPNGADCGHIFFIGSNGAGENVTSLVAFPECGITDLTAPADLMAPGMGIVINVFGTDKGGVNAIRGDGDGNGKFNGLVDGLFILNAAFVPGSPQPPCDDAADADGNGSLNGLVDGLFTLNAQFVPGSPEPPPPFPDCGPITVVLGCDASGCP